MASLFASTKKAEIYFKMRNYTAAQNEIDMAESTLTQHWPVPGKNPFAICCFVVDGPTIYCMDDKIETDSRRKTINVVARTPLFPAQEHERKKLCKVCREMCKERIRALKEKLSVTAQANPNQKLK